MNLRHLTGTNRDYKTKAPPEGEIRNPRAGIQNPNSEIRSPKEARNPNRAGPHERSSSGFGFVSDFGLRVSDLGGLTDEQRSERPSPPFHPVLFLPLSVNFVEESAEVPKTVFVTGMLPCYWIAVSNSL